MDEPSDLNDKSRPVIDKIPIIRPQILDLLALALSRSQVRKIIMADALRPKIDERYPLLVQIPGTLDLRPLWTWLAELPRFIPEQAAPPFCKVKEWGPRLKLLIELPLHLAALPAEEQARLAAQCAVPDEEFEKIFKPRRPTDLRRPTLMPSPAPPDRRPSSQSQMSASPTSDRGPSGQTLPPQLLAQLEEEKETTFSSDRAAPSPAKKRALIGAALGLVVLLVVLFALRTSSGGVSQLDPGVITREIPLKGGSVLYVGQTIKAVLGDANWLHRPEAERRGQLERAFLRAKSYHASGFQLTDGGGEVLASVEESSPPGQPPTVRFGN